MRSYMLTQLKAEEGRLLGCISTNKAHPKRIFHSLDFLLRQARL
jgi:hypothetical protein